jgi:hypothetical protein
VLLGEDGALIGPQALAHGRDQHDAPGYTADLLVELIHAGLAVALVRASESKP